MTKLSDTARVVLAAAMQHPMALARPPEKLPAAARNAVFKRLIKGNLLTEINAPREYVGLGWRQDADGTWIVAKITDEGFRAMGIDPNEGDAQPGEPDASGIEGGVPEGDRIEIESAFDSATGTAGAQPAQQTAPTNLRDAATAFLAAWDAIPDPAHMDNPITRSIAHLRAALAKPARQPAASRAPREGTKQDAVLAMLRRTEGATVEQIAEQTGWAHHTVRGFFAGLKKKGHAVEVKERIRQVGPNKSGAKGSYTIYALAE